MTRSVPAAVAAAVVEDTTQPIYLIHMAWAVASPDVNRYIATWDRAISWNSITWAASGADIRRLSPAGGSLTLPNGDTDPWLTLVTAQNPKGRAIEIYERHTDRTVSPHVSDATLIFAGQMEDSEVTAERISINFVEGLLNKTFPHTSIDPAVYTHLLAAGTRIYWGPDVVLVE